MPSVVFVLYMVSNRPFEVSKKKTSEEELKTKQEAPKEFIILPFIIIIITANIIIIITRYSSVEIIRLQSHISAYLQGLLLQNS